MALYIDNYKEYTDTVPPIKKLIPLSECKWDGNEFVSDI